MAQYPIPQLPLTAHGGLQMRIAGFPICCGILPSTTKFEVQATVAIRSHEAQGPVARLTPPMQTNT